MPGKRRRKTKAKTRKPTPRWSGSSTLVDGHCHLYDSFELDGEEYHVGDCVGLQNPAINADDFVAQLVKLYQHEGEEEMFCNVRWFYRAADIAELSKKERKAHDPQKLYASIQEDVDQPLEAVNRKCYAVHRDDYDSKTASEDTFYYDQSYDPLTGSFKPVPNFKRRSTQGMDRAFNIDSDSEHSEFDAEIAEMSESEDDEKDAEIEELPQTPPRRKGSRKTQPQKRPAKTTKKPRARKRPRKLSLEIGACAKPRGELSDEFEVARSSLHVSSVPDSLPCREQEFSKICRFIKDHVKNGKGACMYVGGTPGTGKTETIRAVARTLQSELSGKSRGFQFVEINAMGLATPQHFYCELWKKLSDSPEIKVSPSNARDLLHKKFTTPHPGRRSTVVLVDEIDLLQTRTQSVLYNIFDWPNQRNSRLIVVAAGNQIDLLGLSKRVGSRLGTKSLPFEQYTVDQLCEIVQARLAGLQVFELEAIKLCARKVCAVAGDARACLDICRRAAQLANEEGDKTVKAMHVHKVVKDLSSTAKIQGVRTASLHERLHLVALLVVFRETGREEATFGQVVSKHLALCRQRNIVPPALSALYGVCSRLSASHLLYVEKREHGIHQTVYLGDIRSDEISIALSDDPVIQCLERSADY